MVGCVLITGGGGFIGSHVADELAAHGYRIRLLDDLIDQVHGEDATWPRHLAGAVEPMRGDVRDPEALKRALHGTDAVVHLASLVGVGQSMYRVRDYVSVNDLGTAALLQALIEHPIERLVVASSMSIYGEGLYRSGDGALVDDAARSTEQLRRGAWDPVDGEGRPLEPLPTPEHKRPELASVYALSKYAQERMCLLIGEAYAVPTVALRFFNVFGARQALSNPYTGVLAIFASRLLNGRPPMIFEDGAQRRDFVDVRDVARACRLALEAPQAAGHAINVGSGTSRSITDVALRLAAVLERPDLRPQISGRYRTGDVRHCFADLDRARELLGFEPRVSFEEGLLDLGAWLASQIALDRVEEATEELSARGLVA